MSPVTSMPECFAIKRGEMEGRLSAEFYRPEFRELSKRLHRAFPDVKPLTNYAEVVCGPFGTEITLGDYEASPEKDRVPLLRISNITNEGTLDLTDVVYISRQKSDTLAKTQVRPGDVVISQRGTLGMPAVISNEFPVYNISANLIAIRQPRALSSRFIQLFLASSIGERQIERLQSGQVHAKITTQDVCSLLIPVVPQQEELVAAMDAARASRQGKLDDAARLLSGIDSYLLAQLSIAGPSGKSRRTYAVRMSDVVAQGRLNAEYFHPERTSALRSINTSGDFVPTRLSEIVEVVREQIDRPSVNYLGLANVQSNTGELVHAEEEVSGTCVRYKAGDILFARLRPYLNKVYRAHMDGCCSPEFYVFRVRETRRVHPDYLAIALRSSITLAQTRHMMTGNTHPRLTSDDIASLLVPIAHTDHQHRIVKEAERRKEEARRLSTEAYREWDSAKASFEAQLLRGAEK